MNNGGDDDDGVDLSSVAIRYLITDLHMIIIMVIMMMMMKIMTMIMIMMMTMTCHQRSHPKFDDNDGQYNGGVSVCMPVCISFTTKVIICV